MDMKVLIGVLYLLLALYTLNFVFNMYEVAILSFSKWIITVMVFLFLIESWKYFKSGKSSPAPASQ